MIRVVHVGTRRRDWEAKRRTARRAWLLLALVVATWAWPTAAQAVTSSSTNARASALAQSMAQRIAEITAVDGAVPDVACSPNACSISGGEWTFAVPRGVTLSHVERANGWTLAVSTDDRTVVHDSAGGRSVTEAHESAVLSLTDPLEALGESAAHLIEEVFVLP